MANNKEHSSLAAFSAQWALICSQPKAIHQHRERGERGGVLPGNLPQLLAVVLGTLFWAAQLGLEWIRETPGASNPSQAGVWDLQT